jgi:hypothetical protein
MPSQEFRAQCAEHLSAEDVAAVEAVWEEDGGARHPALAAWGERDTEIRNAIARIRARHLQTDAARYLREHEDVDVSIEKAVTDAFNMGTPMDREHSIDELRWRIIDELTGVNEFDGAAIVAYALKLKLAERWAALNVERGQEQLERLMRPRTDSEENTDAGTAEVPAAPAGMTPGAA